MKLSLLDRWSWFIVPTQVLTIMEVEKECLFPQQWLHAELFRPVNQVQSGFPGELVLSAVSSTEAFIKLPFSSLQFLPPQSGGLPDWDAALY